MSDDCELGSLRDVPLHGQYTPEDEPFANFYVPMLSRAVAYDRAVGYWSAAELKLAAQGVAHFLAHDGKMRLIVGAQLNQHDVDAVIGGGEPLDDVVARRLLADPSVAGARIVADEHLRVLAWMVANGRLEVRVGVPRIGDRLLTYEESGQYFHTKYGIFTDAEGNRVAFNGSTNASVTAWLKNHETLDVFPSWISQVWDWNGEPKVAKFEQQWEDHADAGWAVIPLPEAVRQHLVHHAPEEPPVSTTPVDDGDQGISEEPEEGTAAGLAWEELKALAAAPAASEWTAVGTAQVEPLPHQAELVKRVVDSFPRGYLFADEVGLGKTIEAGLVLRELLLRRRVTKALLLVPASVMRQWQEELHEKMNLDVVRYDKGVFVDVRGNEVAADPRINPWSAFPVVLASSHLARRADRRKQILDAGPWDVVLVDEAHHARRRGSKPTDTPNSLLRLLLDMRDRQSWQALYLVSATPMQMNPHEAWDLISLLGLRGLWAESARDFIQYFENLRDTDYKLRDWQLLSRMLHDYFDDPGAERDTKLESDVKAELGFVGAFDVTSLDNNPPSSDVIAQMPSAKSHWMDEWLRRHTPMRDRVFRNTRQTMRAYQAAGIIPPEVIIPVRHVSDEFIDLKPNERTLYDRIEQYIRRHYNAYQGTGSQQALGFIMTVYRRRLTSSFEAIKLSLRRRLDVLEQGKSLNELLADDDNIDVEDSLFDPEQFDASAALLKSEITELRAFLADLDRITGEDSKASQLVQDVNAALHTFDSLVVFTQYADTMDYVRRRLIKAGVERIGCYSGQGGEIWDQEAQAWVGVSKSDIKNRFRNHEMTVLVGTDSMSEGLNLQTCGRLINYDMPWNLMRVEQRIGRVDRIGAAYKDIQVTNYFYADTVEERVYKGIKEDYDDFTAIVGEAAPVLASVEKAIEQLALGQGGDTDVAEHLREIRNDLDDLSSRPVSTEDLGVAVSDPADVKEPPTLMGDIGLPDLARTMLNNPLTAPLFTTVDGQPGVYDLAVPTRVPGSSLTPGTGVERTSAYERIAIGTAKVRVTFDRKVADESNDPNLVLLTYGTPALEAILPVVRQG